MYDVDHPTLITITPVTESGRTALWMQHQRYATKDMTLTSWHAE
jgi:hypothetical protein